MSAYREPVGRPVAGPVQMLVGNLKEVCGMAYGGEVLRGMNGACEGPVGKNCWWAC